MKNKKDQEKDGENVIAVSRAIGLLESFLPDDEYLSLLQLSTRTQLHKSTVLRIARTLAHHRYLVQREDGAWRLGPAAGWLGARYRSSFDVSAAVEPVLQDLSALSSESSTFFVQEGEARICLYRIEGPQAIRFHISVGQVLPLDKGSPGKVILAFSGKPGRQYDAIRRQGYYISIGERDQDVASISAPVYGVNWKLLGAISISGPSSRLSRVILKGYAETLITKANRLSLALGGKHKGLPPNPQRTTWHP